MALRNSMRTKTWLFERTTFPLKFGQNGRGAKARSRSWQQHEPPEKAILEVESRKDIVYTSFDFSKHISFFIQYCLLSTRAYSAFCTRTHMHA